MNHPTSFVCKHFSWRSEYSLFILTGILLCISIVAGTAALFGRDKAVALDSEAERGKRLATMLAGHVARTMTSIDNTMDSLGRRLTSDFGVDRQTDNPSRMAQIKSIIEKTVLHSSHLRSLSIMDAAGLIVISSNHAGVGRQLDLKNLGFSGDMAAGLEFGRLQPAHELHELGESSDLSQMKPDGGEEKKSTSYVLPISRSITLGESAMTLLATVNPASLVPESSALFGNDAVYGMLFDEHENILRKNENTSFCRNGNFSSMPVGESWSDKKEIGQFRFSEIVDGRFQNGCLVSFRAVENFPLVAVITMLEPPGITGWEWGASNLKWLGLIMVCGALVYTALLLRMTFHRKKMAHELAIAKEAVEQAAMIKKIFLSTMSHELRTPMNAVLGMTSLLRKTSLDAEQAVFAETIEDSANALMTLIENILEFSEIDAGNLVVDAVDCSLLSIVEETVSFLAGRARKQNLKLMSYVDPRLPTVVKGDPRRLRQILLHLVGNAIKFTPAGNVILRVSLLGHQGGQCQVRFEVVDSGIGIDKKNAAMLFLPFTQADGSTTRKYGGIGLGLSLSARLVTLMGGDIRLESEPAKGSSFQFDLAMPAMREAPSLASLYEVTGTRITIVEPHPEPGEILSAYLRSWGASVTLASNGASVVRQMEEGNCPHVVIIGTGLDDMAPASLVARLSRIQADMHFVLLTHAGEALAEVAGQGFNAVLAQPVRQAALFDSIVVGEKNQQVLFVSEKEKAESGSKCILLVEDNLMNRKVAFHQLTRLGYKVHVACNGQEAVDAIAMFPYVLVLMDCQMPVMDGFEATRRIRQWEYIHGGHIQIVAMTANTTEGDREDCLDAGMDDYLPKPFLPEQLAELVARRLSLIEESARFSND